MTFACKFLSLFVRFDHLVVNADRFKSPMLEEATGSMNATADLFDVVHTLSPNQPLFLSDLDILDKSKYTQVIMTLNKRHTSIITNIT